MHPQIATYIEQFETADAEFLHGIHALIMQSHPAITQKYIYRCPFYAIHQNMCYLVYNKKHKRFVLGFIQGNKMADPHQLLVAEDGQQYIRHLILNKNSSLNTNIILEYLQLAIEINTTAYKKNPSIN